MVGRRHHRASRGAALRRLPLFVTALAVSALAVLLIALPSPGSPFPASPSPGSPFPAATAPALSLRVATASSPAPAGCAVNVAYAGSLEYLVEKVIGPAFAASSGCSYVGEGAGSYALAQEILAKEIFPSVFLSVGSGPIDELRPVFTRWSVELAADPLVIAYNPHSRAAPAFVAVRRHRAPLASLFEVMAKPGFRLGRTDPTTDPQGQAFVMMVDSAQRALHLPAGTAAKVLGPLENPTEIFAETALDSYLEEGQLDAASAFRAQAVELHLPYVALPASLDFGSPGDAAAYAQAKLTLPTGRRLHGTPLVVEATAIGEPTLGARRFLAGLLSAGARHDFEAAGFSLVPPRVLGRLSALPALVRSAFRRSRE